MFAFADRNLVSVFVWLRMVLLCTFVAGGVEQPVAFAEQNQPLQVVSVLQHHQGLCRPHDIEVQGSLAFVAGKGGSVAIVDVAQRQQPRLLWWEYNPKKLEDAQTVLPRPGVLLLGARDVLAWDISNPAKPVKTGQLTERRRVDRINGMALRGNFAFTANKTGWVSVIDLTEPQNPRLQDALDVRAHGELVSPHDIAAWDDYIAVVSQSSKSTYKFRVYQVADPNSHDLLACNAWKVCGGIDRKDLLGANRVMVSAGFAYLACSQHDNFQLGVIDVRTPEHPRHVTTLPFAGQYPTGLTVAGQVLFAAGGQSIQALDVSHPSTPRTLAVLHTEEVFPTGRDNAHDLVYHAGHLFVTAQNDDQIGIIQVADDRIRRLAELQSK